MPPVSLWPTFLSLQNPNPKCLLPSLLPLKKHSSSDPTNQSSPSQEDELPILIAHAVLHHSGDNNPRTLARYLSRLSPNAWSPALVDRIMKRLWNDGPHRPPRYSDAYPVFSPRADPLSLPPLSPLPTLRGAPLTCVTFCHPFCYKR